MNYGHVLMWIKLLLWFKQQILASVDHMYAGEVGPVLMMELVPSCFSGLSFLFKLVFDYKLL